MTAVELSRRTMKVWLWICMWPNLSLLFGISGILLLVRNGTQNMSGEWRMW